MNIAEPILKLFRKPSVPTVEVGDVVRVHQKIKEGGKERIQVFEGIVIATHEKDSLDATFTVRKIASGVGVERTYLLHSPRITKIEFKRSSTVRRAKLYYLRNLTGKALKMKDRKVVKDSWDGLLTGQEVEATEADIAEAVAAAQEAEAQQEQTATEEVVVAGNETQAADDQPEVEKTSVPEEDGVEETPAHETDSESVDPIEPEAEVADANDASEPSEQPPAAA